MHPAQVEAFRSALNVITLQRGSVRHKAFQVFFGRDRSLFVSFPYFKHRVGILAASTIPGNGQTTSQVDLQIAGKLASHKVKYSHHPDGRAHFSQHGKIQTVVRRQSLALDQQRGHIFTIMIQGAQKFEPADAFKDIGISPKRSVLNFQLDDSADGQTVKLVGRWFDVATMRFGADRQSVVGPTIIGKDPTGKLQNGFLLASPYANAQHVLFVTCETIDRVSPEPELLLFYGGFAPRTVMDDTAQDAGFLAFIYPAANAEALKKTIGTIDL
jgi:hypothetical protein